MRLVLSVVLALAFALPGLACDRPDNLGAIRAAVIDRMNDARSSAGLPALREQDTLTGIAQSHACDNAARGKTSHRGSDGSSLTTRLRNGGYRYATAAENTGRGFDGPSATNAVAFWMESRGHRANILNRQMRDVGVGIAMGGGRPHWVVNFGAQR